MAYNKMWISKNLSKKERNARYNFLREAGLTREQAKRIMDWTMSHILKYIKANTKEKNGKYTIETN